MARRSEVRSWRTLGLVMVAFFAGPLGQGGVAWTMAEQSQGESQPGLASVAQSVAPAEAILDVLVSRESRGTRLVVVGDGEFDRYKVSLLKEPPRIVLDLWGVQKHRVEAKRISPTMEIERVRVGRHEDRIRLVADLARSTNVIPPYSLRREGAKLVLCVGEMARGGPIEQAEPPESAIARVTSQPWKKEEGRLWIQSQSGENPGTTVKDQGPGEQRFLARVGSYQIQEQDLQDAEYLPVMVWNPKPVEGVGKEAPDPGVKLQSSPSSIAPALALASWSEREGPDTLAEVSYDKGERIDRAGSPPGVWEVDLNSGSSLLAQRASWGDPRVERPNRGGTMAAAGPSTTREAVSLGQVATVTPAKEKRAVSLIDEEEEQDFKISTGMEPGKAYSGQRLDLDLQDIDLDNVFRLLAEVSNLNIIVSEKVKGKVTMRLKDVPWDQVLDLILSTQKLGMVRQGNVLRVAPLKDLVDEEKERKRLRQERIQARIESEKRLQEAEIEAQERQRKLRPFVTEFIVLNYTKAKDFQTQIKDILTKEPKIDRVGTAVVDDRTNTVTVTDYPEKIERIKQYKERVDKPTPQVLIEARIVKASKNFARELGIQWGTQFAEFDRKNEWAWGISSATSTTGTAPTSPSAWTSGAFSAGTGHDFFPLSGWMVNLPATILPGPPGIGLQIGRLAGDLINLDLRLSAAEREGLTKIISRPKVMTLDNVEATIKQGREIPFTQVNPEGNVSVVYKEASLKTTVTPQISPDGRVRLKLDVTDDFPDRANANPITGNPEIVKRQGTTEVLVRDGETVVIGGVLEETRATAEEGVPWLKDLPGLSWLFERKQRRLDQTELLIFVTPFIVEQT